MGFEETLSALLGKSPRGGSPRATSPRDEVCSLSEGRLFEFEAALHSQLDVGQKVEGFSLNIIPIDSGLASPVVVNFYGEDFILRQTEFDVVTDRYLIECKSCGRPEHYLVEGISGDDPEHGKLWQFNKEHNVLGWFRSVWDDIVQGEMQFKARRDSTGDLYLSLSGRRTNYTNIGFKCSWFKDIFCPEEYVSLWLNLIKNLTTKEFVIFFKNRVPAELRTKIQGIGVTIFDGDEIYTNAEQTRG